MDPELVRYERELDALIGSATRFLFIDPEYMHRAVDAEWALAHAPGIWEMYLDTADREVMLAETSLAFVGWAALFVDNNRPS